MIGPVGAWGREGYGNAQLRIGARRLRRRALGVANKSVAPRGEGGQTGNCDGLHTADQTRLEWVPVPIGLWEPSQFMSHFSDRPFDA